MLAPVFMSRLFLSLGGAGMILFSYLFALTESEEAFLPWDRIGQALLCVALWAISFALPLGRAAVRAAWLRLAEVVAILYGMHTVVILFAEGISSLYLLSTLVAVQLVFLFMRSLRFVQLYAGAQMGLVLLLLSFVGGPLSLRLFVGLGFAVLCAVNYAAAHARFSAFERLAGQQAAMQGHMNRAQEAEQLLHGILDSSLSGVMAFKALRDSEGRIADFEWVLANRAAEQVVGFSEKELLGQRLLEVMPGNREEGLFERYAAVVETGRPLVMEHYYDHERVSRQWFHTAAVKLGDGFAVTFSDISDRKRAEEKLRESEGLLRTVMDASPAWIFIKDSRSQYRLVNEACASALGLKPEVMIGKTDRALGLCLEERDGRRQAGQESLWGHEREVLESGQPFRQEAAQLRLGARLLHVSVLQLPLKDGGGQIWGVLGFVQDISAHKRSEAELRKLSLVARHTNTGVVITNAAGQVEWVNEGFVHLTGYELEEIRGKKPGGFLQGPETDPETVARIGQGLRAQVSFREDIVNYHKNGSSYWISLYITPIFDEQGRVERFIAIENDISLQKEAERQLRLAKEAAEAAAAAKAEFLANMSHEIRTPMNAVIGLTGLLLDSSLSEEQREYVEIIRNSGDNLLTVINDILDFSKIESGKLELERQPFRLHETVEDILDLLSSKAREKGIELIYRMAPDVPAAIVGDPTRISQVLMNLVGNAIKFTREGEVEVSVSRVCSESGGLVLRFEVRDTGIGIPADKLGRLFKSFSQVDASTTRQYGGTGLGLAISQRLVQMMGGEVGVRSTLGEGSVFSFTIETEAADLPGLEPAGRLDGVRALILDDNRTNLTILREQLAQWGCEAQPFEQPAEALLRLADAAERVDLVITDMQMPVMDGYSFARQVRALPQRAGLPLLVLTSMGEGLSEEGRQLFDACLSKPVRRQQLLRHIRRALRQGEPAAARPEALAQDQSLRFSPSLRILLAEDNAVNQKVASRILEKFGLHCDIAANGSEALTAVDAKDYDLILMDMQMPVMDGITATRHIRQRSLHQPLIIAMTANAMTGDRERCLEAGMNDYISKPVKLEDVAETLARWFEPQPLPATPAR
jgi:PAS domain S-box-containing protein